MAQALSAVVVMGSSRTSTPHTARCKSSIWNNRIFYLDEKGVSMYLKMGISTLRCNEELNPLALAVLVVRATTLDG